MRLTAQPSVSTTDRCVVSLLSAGHWKDSSEETDALFSWIVRRSDAAYSFETSRSTGMSLAKAGSPR